MNFLTTYSVQLSIVLGSVSLIARLLELLNQAQAGYIPNVINDVILSDFTLPSDFD